MFAIIIIILDIIILIRWLKSTLLIIIVLERRSNQVDQDHESRLNLVDLVEEILVEALR